MNSEFAIYDVNIHQETNGSYTMTIGNRTYHYYDDDALLDALKKYLKREKIEKKKIDPEDVLGASDKKTVSPEIGVSGMPGTFGITGCSGYSGTSGITGCSGYVGSSGVTGLSSSWCSSSAYRTGGCTGPR